MYRTFRKCRPVLYIFLIFSVVALFNCGEKLSRVTFSVKGETPNADGSFINRCCSDKIKLNLVKIVLGDFQLSAYSPDRDPEIDPNPVPLLPPGQTEVPADELGRGGRFPGLWALDITKGITPRMLPIGQVEPIPWQGIKFRMAPAVSGVRGLSGNDPLAKLTVYAEGTAITKKGGCDFTLKLLFSLGFSRRISFKPQPGMMHRNVIEINYSKWFDDISFQNICNARHVEITEKSHPKVAEKIRNAIPYSVNFKGGAPTVN